MTVEELIRELMKIEDKTLEVVKTTDGRCSQDIEKVDLKYSMLKGKNVIVLK